MVASSVNVYESPTALGLGRSQRRSAIDFDQPQANTGITIVNPDAGAGMVEVIEWVEDAFTAQLDIPNVARAATSATATEGYTGTGSDPTIWICDKWYPKEQLY